MDIAGLLRNADLFKGMNDEFIRKFSSGGHLRGLNKGELLFAEGTRGASFFMLISGGIRLFKTSADGNEIPVRLVNPGEIFAEVILFEIETYPVSAVAVLNTEVFIIERSFFLELLDEKTFRNEFIANIMRKQRYLTERIMYLTTYDVEMRFFRFLVDRYGRQESYRVDMSKKEIAAAIGTIPETLSRLILRLKNSGIIHWEGAQLRVDPAYVEEILLEG